MKDKNLNSSINYKAILICIASLFLFLLIIRSSFSDSQKNSPLISSFHSITSAPNPTNNQDCPSQPNQTPKCTKIPPSLSHALVYYATLNITPQQTLKEISISLKPLQAKSPCNYLVFGLGHDSLMWKALNHGGRTVFLEESMSWIKNMKKLNQSLEVYHVVYDTKLTQANELHEIGMQEDCRVVSDPRISKCKLALKGLPNVVYETQWDLIMIDAPTGYHEGAPGRMTAIYTAGLMAKNRKDGETDVFVHDVHRVVEDRFSMSFLCERYFVEQEGLIRHFNIQSHKARSGRPFCP